MKPENAGLFSIATLTFISVLYSSALGGRPPYMPGKSAGAISKLPDSSLLNGGLENNDLQPSSGCYRDVTQLLDKFFQLNAEIARHDYKDEFFQLNAEMDRHDYKLEFLVATVPDPIDSHLDWDFDLYLDAIQSAIVASGYVLDRYSFPWECARESGKRLGTKDEKERDPELADLHRREPGVILFRDWDVKTQKGRLLVLFLVGETPTAGIHKEAFAEAVRFISRNVHRDACAVVQVATLDCQNREQPSQQEVRILGPSFSGSAASLRIAIKQFEYSLSQCDDPPLQFKIISGSATNLDNKKILEDALLGRVTFHATAIPDQVVIPIFKGYLREELHVDPEKVAVLQESNTVYGGSFKQGDWLVLPFPMHVSQVRSAYEKDKLKKAGRTDDIKAIPRLALELSLDETGNPRDVFPTFSPQMTAASDELVLDNILSTISREGIQYVGLFATSSRDKLFLAQQIRKYCPDVRLFTFGSDILYTHPDYRSYLEGMIVASTYPLFNKNQRWTFPFQGGEGRLQFPIDEVEGIYNATLALLGRTDILLEYATPFGTSVSLVKRKPPIWLSVVGRGGLWPLKFFSSYDDQGYVYRANYVFKDDQGNVYTALDYGFKVAAPDYDYDWHPVESYSLTQGAIPKEEEQHFKFWLFVFVLISIFCLVQAAGYFVVADRPRNDPLPNRWQFFDVFRPRYCLDDQPQQRLYALICFLTLLIVYTLLAALFFLPTLDWLAWLTDWWVWPIRMLVAVCLLLLLGATVDAALRAFRPRWKKGWRICVRGLRTEAQRVLQGSWQLRAFAVASALILLSLLATALHCFPWVVQKLWLLPGESMFFYERATNLASGLSPVVPVLFLGAGWYLWGLCHLKRLRLLEGLATPSPFDSEGCSCAGIDTLEKRVKDVLQKPFPSGPWFFLGLLLWGVPCCVLFWKFLPTFEGRSFDCVFRVAWVLLYLGIVLAFLQFLALWYHFRRWLRRLALHPMVEAYSRLPLQLSRTLGGQLWARVPTVADLELSVQYLLLLANHFGEIRIQLATQLPLSPLSHLPETMVQVQNIREEFSSDLRNHGVGGTVSRSDTWELLLQAAQALHVEALEPFWQRRPLQGPVMGVPAVSDEPSPEAKITMKFYTRGFLDSMHVWLRLAEDFVALQMVTFISQVFAHLRNLLIFVTAGVLLLLLAITSYPFQPQQLLMVFIWIVILSVVTGTLTVFVQMEWSEVLSRIAKTDPNQVTFNRTFLTSILTYGVLPLVGLLFTLFPAMGGLFSWIEPVLRAFK